jgi:hypothetical protein
VAYLVTDLADKPPDLHAIADAERVTELIRQAPAAPLPG